MIALEIMRGGCPDKNIEFSESDDYYIECSSSSLESEDS